MTIQAPISHHFAPIFYLSSWAKNHRVTRYYRPYAQVVASRIAPKNTGYDDYLYTLHGVPTGQQQWLETHFFSPVDSRASIAHQLMLDGNPPHDQRSSR